MIIGNMEVKAVDGGWCVVEVGTVKEGKLAGKKYAKNHRYYTRLPQVFNALLESMALNPEEMTDLRQVAVRLEEVRKELLTAVADIKPPAKTA